MSDDSTPGPDPREIARAEASVESAARALAVAEAKASAAYDAVEDAAGDVSVAEAKLADFQEAEGKLPWQIAAAEADLAKKRRAHERAKARHATVAERVDAVREALDAAHVLLAQARATPATPIPDDAGVPPGAAPEVVAWVEKLTSYLESQEKGDSAWCPQWHEHPEAVWRFTALHREFEISVLEDTMSGWWVNHFDRHAPFLFGASGIFQGCENGHDPDRRFQFARRD